jgi:hypothetical protein
LSRVRLLVLAAALACTISVACSSRPPRVDASSDAALKASIARVRGSLNAADQKRFDNALEAIVADALHSALSHAAAANAAGIASAMRGALNGKTGEEIIAMGAPLVEQRQRSAEPPKEQPPAATETKNH